MDSVFAKLAEILPKLRTQFGLIGLIVLVGGVVATRSLAPANAPAQLVAGLVGVNLVVFGQVFYFLRAVPAQRRATLVIWLFAFFCTTTLGALGATIFLVGQDRLTVTGLSLAGEAEEAQTSPNTLDDLVVSWSHAGSNEDLQVSLIEIPTGKRIVAGTVAAADHRLRVQAKAVQPLWPEPSLGERYQVRAELQGATRSFSSAPVEVQSGLLILYFLEGQTVTVASMRNPQHIIAHAFDARVVAFPRGGSAEPISLLVHATNGKGHATFPDGFEPDPATLRCVYLGSVSEALVRYQYLGSARPSAGISRSLESAPFAATRGSAPPPPVSKQNARSPVIIQHSEGPNSPNIVGTGNRIEIHSSEPARRRVTADQRRNLATALTGAPCPVEFQARAFDDEGFRFAGELADAVRAAGWPTASGRTWLDDDPGTMLVYTSGLDCQASAFRLTSALSNAGISAKVVNELREGSVARRYQPTVSILVLVGSQGRD